MKEFCTRWILRITTLFSIELLNNLSTSLYSDDTVLNLTRVYCLLDGIEAQLLGLSVFDTFVIGFPFLDDLGRKKLKKKYLSKTDIKNTQAQLKYLPKF